MRRAALGYAGLGGGAAPATGGSILQRAAAAFGPYSATAPQYPPEIAQAQQQYGQYANAGSMGLNALTGQGPNVFMNQYLSQLNPTFDFLRQQAMSDADSRATQMGAFGGSRGDVFAGTAVGDINRAQAGLNYNAFNDAQQRALALANLGYGAGARSAFLPQAYASGQLGLLNQGIGPYGQSTTTQTSSDPFSQLLGLGLIAAGGAFGGPAGAMAGAQLGGTLQPQYQGGPPMGIAAPANTQPWWNY